MTKSYRVKTAGKLYLSGEYAILFPGQLALIKSIPIYMTASIRENTDFVIKSEMFSHAVGREKDGHYDLIQDTIDLFELYVRKPLPPFSLMIEGEMGRDGKKYGIGSSGSVVILTLKALAAFEGLTLSADLLFRLACLVLLKRGDNGSMGDLACIAYHDLVAYWSFDRQVISERLAKESLQTLLHDDWGYRIMPVRPTLPLTFMVGWTQEPAISKDLVKQVKNAITPSFLAQSHEFSQQLLSALKNGQKEAIKTVVSQQVALLSHLHPAIMTQKLTDLVNACLELDAVAKSSGAGGGDCGIAYVFDQLQVADVLATWQQKGIECLYQEEWGNDKP